MIEDLLKSDIQEFIRANAKADVRKLALQKHKYPEWPFDKVLDQIQSRQKAKKKLPSWFENQELLFPPAISMEQCSSEITALYKTSLVKGNSVIDLTGGFGIDLSFITKNFENGTYVEQNEWLCALAKHNYSKLGRSTEVKNLKAVDALSELQNVDLIYLDPTRRDAASKKVIRLEDYSPNVLSLLHQLLSKSKQFMLKVSPMFDIKLGIEQLQYVNEVHVVSVKNEVKELLFLGSNKANEQPKVLCVNLDTDQPDFDFSYGDEEGIDAPLGSVSDYLYEPNSSIIKSGAFKSIAAEYSLIKLHPNTHLYTSDVIREGFPGRVFRIKSELKPNKKEMRKSIPSLKANVSTKNYPLSVKDLIKKTGLKEGGQQFVFGFTDIDSRRLVLCEKLY